VRVLVVDDEPSVADVCREFLSSEGYQVTVAASGEEALRVIPTLAPDVILTDITLPGVSGLEVMRHARTADPGTVVNVVMPELVVRGTDRLLHNRSKPGQLRFALLEGERGFTTPRIDPGTQNKNRS
jgi:CheY-like chemotaxis protein